MRVGLMFHLVIRLYSRSYLVVGFFVGYFIVSVIDYCISKPKSLFLSQSIHDKSNLNFLNGSLLAPAEEDDVSAGSTTLAEKLYDEIRILCWVMTSPLTIQLRAKHISETWGKHCNKVLFMSSENDTHLPAIGLNINEGYDFLWNKTKAAFKYIYTNHLNDADWFVKADDDTYMNIENLRYLITQLKEKSSSYLGRRFKFFFPAGYMSGGAGYVLSKSALLKFVRQGLKAKYSAFCKAEPGGYEDVNMGQCLKYSNIMPIDTRDENNMERFHPYPPYFILTDLFLDKDDWIFNYSYYPWKTGPPCCSTTTISFHYMLPKDMYQTHYLAYHLKPYGLNRNVTVKY